MTRPKAFGRLAMLLCVIGAAGSLGLAMLALIRRAPLAEGIAPMQVIDPEREVGALTCGEPNTVVFRIVNPNPRPLRILGAATS